MGRELKRVPLSFNWPIGTVWAGFLCPLRPARCEHCDRTGYNPKTKTIADSFYAHHLDRFASLGQRGCDKITQDEVDALIAAGRLFDLTHDFTQEGWQPKNPAPTVTAAQVNAMGPLTHDEINRGILVETRAKRLGVYGLCLKCGGSGDIWPSPKEKRAAARWKPKDPPKGAGFQLWENTSEGSPISPVFKTLAELCAWAATNVTTFGSLRTSAAEWERMLGSGDTSVRIGNAVFL